MNGWTIQYIEKVDNGIRFSSEYEVDSLEEAEEYAVSRTADDDPAIHHDVAIIRRHEIVMARYFHTIQIP